MDRMVADVPAPFDLGARLDQAAIEATVVGAFLGQRRRLLHAAISLTGDEWSRASRCAAWNARELVVHVLGATQATRTTLTGERAVFAGGFDPNSGPNAFVEARAGDPTTATLDELEAEIAQTAAAIEEVSSASPSLRVTAVWGEEVDWRLFVTHMFWDAWMHERDLLLPLGRPVDSRGPEARLAVAYGLHSAGIMIGMLGGTYDETLALDGSARASYRVRAAGGTDVRISVRELAAGAATAGDAELVGDAIAGRGPVLTDVLDVPAEVAAPLMQLATFLNPGDPAPAG